MIRATSNTSKRALMSRAVLSSTAWSPTRSILFRCVTLTPFIGKQDDSECCRSPRNSMRETASPPSRLRCARLRAVRPPFSFVFSSDFCARLRRHYELRLWPAAWLLAAVGSVTCSTADTRPNNAVKAPLWSVTELISTCHRHRRTLELTVLASARANT